MTDSKKIDDGGPDLTSLIERVEKAEGPSRELDRAVWEAFGSPSRSDGVPEFAGFLGIAMFSSSIDAAVSLAKRVLPNWQINLSIFRDTLAEASFGNREAPHVRRQATKPALAICLAILSALQSKGAA